jgi:hypothetical protein
MLGRRTFLLGLLACTALTRVRASTVMMVGAIHATKSLLLQRVYIPSFSDDEIDAQWVGPGETLLRLPLDGYVHGGAAYAQAMIGPAAITGRCAVIDANNVVVDLLMADPDIYCHPSGQRVVSSDDLNIGDVWVEVEA